MNITADTQAASHLEPMNNKFELTLSIERADGKKEKIKAGFTLNDCVKSKSCFIEIMKAAISVSDQLVERVKSNAKSN